MKSRGASRRRSVSGVAKGGGAVNSWGAFTPQIRQEILQMRAPVGPVVTAGDLLVHARPVFLLEQSDEAFVRGDEARLKGADVEIEFDGGIGDRREHRDEPFFAVLQRTGLAGDPGKKLRPRERRVGRDEAAERGAHDAATLALVDSAVAAVDRRNEFVAQKI